MGKKGVDGVDVVIGTSSFLREHSHGKDIAWILKVILDSDHTNSFSFNDISMVFRLL